MDYITIKAYIKKYPNLMDLISIDNKMITNDIQFLNYLNIQIIEINKLKNNNLPDELNRLINESIKVKEAYKNFIESQWKDKPLEYLRDIYSFMQKKCINPYYDNCSNILNLKLKEYHELQVSKPTPETLIGEIYKVNITDDFIHNRTGYNIVELYIPYYDIHINTSNSMSTDRLNIFIGSNHKRYDNNPIKTIIISSDLAKRIHSYAKELILNRPEIYKDVSNLLKQVAENRSEG